MLIAQEKRKTNIAEYILYMWQVEDLLRVCSLDPEKIEQQLVRRFHYDENIRKEISVWYKNLAAIMEKEHVSEKGHIQAIVNLVNDLNEFHLKMLRIQNDQEYIRLYQLNREALGDFINKSGMTVANEVEACLNALYGIVLLKLKKAEISPMTQKSVKGFARMIGHLSTRYIQFENDEFEFI